MFQFGTVVVAPYSQMVEGLVFCKENMIIKKVFSQWVYDHTSQVLSETVSKQLPDEVKMFFGSLTVDLDIKDQFLESSIMI